MNLSQIGNSTLGVSHYEIQQEIQEIVMAWYVDASSVVKANGTEAVWTTDYNPGAPVPQSGIYKCRVCNREVTSNANDPFPPQNHHSHPQSQPIKWRLLVWTNTGGS